MKRPLKVKIPAILLGALAALFMGFGSATVGTGVASANPGWNDPGWHGNGWGNQWNNGWPGNGCNNCGGGWNNNQVVWKDGPNGLPGVWVEFYKANWRWCWGGHDWYLTP